MTAIFTPGHFYTCVWELHAQSCPTLCDPVDCSLPGPSVHRIFQARILEWFAISSSRRSSRPRDQTCISKVSYIERWILYCWATWEAFFEEWSTLLENHAFLDRCMSRKRRMWKGKEERRHLPSQPELIKLAWQSMAWQMLQPDHSHTQQRCMVF